MWRALVAFSGDSEIASDALAEAFAQAIRRGSQVSSPERWVWTVAIRIARGELKARAREEPLSRAEPVVHQPDDDIAAVLGALAKLSGKQRAAVASFYLMGYSIRETANMIGSTPAATKVHLHRARTRLRALMQEPIE